MSAWTISTHFSLFENEAYLHGWWVALGPGCCDSHLKLILKRQTLLPSLLRVNLWVQKYSMPKISHQKPSRGNCNCEYSSFLFLIRAVQLHLLHSASWMWDCAGTVLRIDSAWNKQKKTFEHSWKWLKSRLLWYHASHSLSYTDNSAVACACWAHEGKLL